MAKYSVVMSTLMKDPAHVPVVQATIESVRANSKDFEFIIVDDGSTMSSGLLRGEADTYVRHQPKNKGIAPSWNDGKNVSRGEYVVIINDDIRVPRGWLEAMAEPFEENRNCGVVGVMAAGPHHEPGFIPLQPEKDHKWFSGYCFMLKRSKFFKDFDEQFVPFNFEDIDYWEQIQEADLFLYKAPVRIYHAEGDTIHSMNYEKTDSGNLKKFITKWGFNPKGKYFG